MSVARRWVFPIIRIVVFALIAVALVKLAFFSGTAHAADQSVQPAAQVTQPRVVVETGTITNDVTVKALISADPAVPVKATLAGEVKKVIAAQGAQVDANTPVLTIRSETVTDDGTPAVKTVTVLAGSAGVLTSVPVIVGQVVAVGDAVGQVAPPTFSVSGSLAAEKQYRLLNRPTEAQVAITGGPAPFTCTGLTISTATPGASATDGGQSDTGGSAGTTVRCAVPAGVTVFPGLAAKITISGGVASDALVVPTTAVEGTAQAGNVYLAASDGTTTKKAVTLGLTDGKMVQIVSGVAKGDSILEFVPGAAAPCDPNTQPCQQ